MENDLFESPESLPIEVQKILEDFNNTDQTYTDCDTLVTELEKVGYTCNYYLDAVPFYLRKIC